MRYLIILFILLLFFSCTEKQVSSESKNIFYVDANNGSDANSGNSPESAWAGLENVNETIFHPGDIILFKAGTSYKGQLVLNGSGNKNHPVIIDKYGKGNKPMIEAEGNYSEALLLKNVEYWEVQNLELTNNGPYREETRWGVRVLAEEFGEMKHIRLKNLYVHDVNGWLKKSYEEGCGIYWETLGESQSWFNGLHIENCHLVRTDRNGICGSHVFTKRAENWRPSLDVVIRGNLLVDIGGDAIKPWGCDGALVEYNIVRGARTRCDDYAAGIWPWSCDNTLIQYNEVSGVKGYKDGQAFDSDYNCTNTIFQYNYSHDNDGGFMLICTPKPNENNIGCVGTIIRYNLSVNDQTRTFDIGGGVKNTYIYNNTIYVGKGLDVKLVNYGSWGEDNWSDGMYFYNNIFYADEGATFRIVERTKGKDDGRRDAVPGVGKSTNNHFKSNSYYGKVLYAPEDPEGIYED
ncbi:MAG: hypothetical protein KAQ62_18280, partial [Cyclobacteriaceae bacterium]|nr:hypothetical protein [Cyclobacteriaceae bacterium]